MNLKGIISAIDIVINSKLVASNLQPKHAFGLASRYYEGEKYYPGILNGTEITNCFLDDTNNINWFHRNQKGLYTLAENQYGNLNDKVEETNDISLVIYANTKKIGLSLEVIKDVFISAMPSVLSKVECESLNLFNCRIELESHELDTNLVFKEESNHKDVRVGVEHGLILIRYKIKSTYRRGCTVICECN